MRGIVSAWLLASTGAWYHSAPPLLAAALVFAFALFVPLRVGQFLLTRAFAWLLAKIALVVLAVTAIAYPTTLAVNSSQPTIAAFGGVFLIGALVTLAAVVLGSAWSISKRVLPRVIAAANITTPRASGWIAQASAVIKGVRISR